VRCAWGEPGLAALLDSSDVLVIVDVLSFSTCVDVATARRAEIVPVASDDPAARERAAAAGATLAGLRGQARFSLSPGSFAEIAPGARVALPSPNGAAHSAAAAAAGKPAFAGCLRNASAVARAARAAGARVGILAAGERWPDGTLRPCLEDALGAGALADAIAREAGDAALAPEARDAAALLRALRSRLGALLAQCASGRELRERGFPDDVRIAAELDVSAAAPRLRGGIYSDDVRC
jgi:2-phosphosulfolactate phosphatase